MLAELIALSEKAQGRPMPVAATVPNGSAKSTGIDTTH